MRLWELMKPPFVWCSAQYRNKKQKITIFYLDGDETIIFYFYLITQSDDVKSPFVKLLLFTIFFFWNKNIKIKLNYVVLLITGVVCSSV